MKNMTTTTTMMAAVAIGKGEECDDWQQRSKSDGYSDKYLTTARRDGDK
jgi:hypothetical protein